MKWLKSKNKEQPKLSLNQEQETKLAELGARLCASRQQQALSLEEMVGLTKIPLRLLEAIEQGKLEDLPEPVYLQGLIRQFADALGLNGAEFASSFPLGRHKRVSLPLKKKKSQSLLIPLQRYSIGLLRPIHLYLLYISVILCSVSSLSHALKSNAVSDSNQQPGGQTVFQAPPNQLNSPQLSASLRPVRNSVNDTNNSESVHIGVTLKASSWIRIVADGKVQFEGVLPQGTQRTWKAQEELTVKTDNGGSVLMSVNQQAAQQIGESGKYQEIKISSKATN